ncbi:transporter [Mesorhizobium sp. M0276]|uniref:transporter n=1 Tax=Mesorhizobium sp. M0276 TaxID=2956928 RepID=UPI0033358968
MSSKAPIRIAVMVSSESGAGCIEFGQFLAVYYALLDAGAEVLVASASGGYPWPTRLKRGGEEHNELTARFQSDWHARDDLANTLQFGQLFVEDFQGGFCVGEPGAIWRAADLDSVGALIARFLRAGRPIAVLPSLFDFTPTGAADGLLILSDGKWPPIATVGALLAAATQFDNRRIES